MHILVTSAGRRSYLIRYFKEALGGDGKVYASNSSYTIALKEADGYFISPLIYDDTYIDSLLSFCKKKNIKTILSLFDIDLLVLSRAKAYLESQGIRLLLPEENTILTCNDKWRTYMFLCRHGLKTPKTYKSLKTTKEAIKNKQISYPVIVKPRWGMGSMGLYTADNKEELEVFYRKCLKEVRSTHLKYESTLTPKEPVIFQEMLKGEECGVDVINDLEGNFVCALPKVKMAMRAGETDLGKMVGASRFLPVAKILSEKIKHEVILSVDCFDVNGDIYVLEMNCRISGHYPVSHMAGANLPKQIVEWLKGEPTNMQNFKYKKGVVVTKDLVPVVLDGI